MCGDFVVLFETEETIGRIDEEMNERKKKVEEEEWRRRMKTINKVILFI